MGWVSRMPRLVGPLALLGMSAQLAPNASNPQPTERAPFKARFDQEVKPLLSRTCAPCHMPDGQMYDRLPFDDPEVVRSHREGILKRLKGDDRATVEKWLDGPAETPPRKR